MSFEMEMLSELKAAREAAHHLARSSSTQRNLMLGELASAIRKSSQAILAANRDDLCMARIEDLSAAFLERLALSENKIETMARGVEEVAALPDPVGEIITAFSRPNGLRISQVRVPIGVIAVVYESRPNVTIDAAALVLKAGNAAVLRGGKEALATNSLLARLISRALEAHGLPRQALFFVRDPDRTAVQILKHQADLIDLIVPRGGLGLKQALTGSAVPLLPHFDGICHTYVDRAANLKMAEEICFNAKCSRPSVCNAMENLLVHAEVAERFLPALAKRLTAAGVELRGCTRTRALAAAVRLANDDDWDTEYLDLILSVKIVDSLDEAIEFIARHGSGLADAIVTEDREAAERFEHEVDSATVYVNASTRFTDGFEFGFGAETGISTSRLHARGPMGLRELTTYKYVIRGNGQIRV